MSSAVEVQDDLYIAVDQEYVAKKVFDSLYKQAGKTSQFISGLIKYLSPIQDKQIRRPDE